MKSHIHIITSLILLVILPMQISAQNPQSLPDSLQNDTEQSFILVPTAAASPFPAFYLVDTTLSTLVVDEGLSIQVELHKVDFMAKTDYKHTPKRRPKEEIAVLPRRKDGVTLPDVQTKKLTL